LRAAGAPVEAKGTFEVIPVHGPIGRAEWAHSKLCQPVRRPEAAPACRARPRDPPSARLPRWDDRGM